MKKFITGPVLTLFVLLAIYFIPQLSSASPAFVVVVYAAYVGGLWPGLISAAMVCAYMGIVYPPEYIRLIAAALSVFGSVLLVAELKRYAELAQSINGNLERLQDILNDTQGLLNNWAVMTDEARRRAVLNIEDGLASILTLIYGWRAIKKEIEEAKRLAGSDKL